jgi:hypothetical protein
VDIEYKLAEKGSSQIELQEVMAAVDLLEH